MSCSDQLIANALRYTAKGETRGRKLKTTSEDDCHILSFELIFAIKIKTIVIETTSCFVDQLHANTLQNLRIEGKIYWKIKKNYVVFR